MQYFFLTLRALIVIAQRVIYYITLGHFPPPFLGASIIIKKGEKILMIDRKDALGLSLPGGFVKLHEKVADAALREAKEETGLDIEIQKIITILSGKRSGLKMRVADIVYEGKITGDGKLRDSLEGQCKWIDIKNIDQFRIAFDHIDVLKNL